MEKIFDLIKQNTNILEALGEETDSAQGEIEAVLVRLPQRITQASFVNLFIASKIKKGAKALKKDGKDSAFVWKAVKTIDKYETVTISDRVTSLLADKNADREIYAEFAKYLITEGETLKQVKFGLSLLGVFGTQEDAKLVYEVGCCEEFTFFSVKSLHRLVPPEEFQNFAVTYAESLNGWGKVAAILELPDNVEDSLKERILSIDPKTNIGQNLACEIAIKGSLFSFINDAADSDSVSEKKQNDVLNIFKALFEAENIQNADGFDEIPSIREISQNYVNLVESGKFNSNEEICDIIMKLKAKFGF